MWFYSDAAVLIISDYMLQYVLLSIDHRETFLFSSFLHLRFPEITVELIKKPKDDTYAELNIWPTRKGYVLVCAFDSGNFFIVSFFIGNLDCKTFVHGLRNCQRIPCRSSTVLGKYSMLLSSKRSND
jgi:hypothetical protein